MAFRRGGWCPALGAVLFLCGSWAQAEVKPEELAARIAKAGDAAKYDNAPCVVVLDDSDVWVRESGLATVEQCVVTKILTEEGVARMSVQRFDFDPTSNALTITAVRIHRSDGAVEEVDASAHIEQPQPAGIIFWGARQQAVAVPGLRVGDTVETRTSKTGSNVAYLGESDDAAAGLTPPMPGHWYDVVRFQQRVPIIEQRYAVNMPKDKPLQYEIYNGELQSSLKFDGQRTIYAWQAKDIPAYKGESQGPSMDDVICKLVLATLPDWEQKATWFYQANEPSFQTDEDIKAAVADIVSEYENREDQIAALTHWVAENIRYVGTSRGACEGYTTHPVTQTFRDRGGVCKDKAGMLVAMLREAGFESYIVITEAGSRVESIPADQFNHAVTSIREPDGRLRLLDPTWAPKSRELWSSREQLQHVLFATPEQGVLTTSPYSGPEQNSVVCRGRLEIMSDGSLRGRYDMVVEGYPETNFRRRLAGTRPDERGDAIQALAADLAPQVELENVAFGDPVDFSRPLTVSADLTAPGYAAGDNGVRLFRLPTTRILFNGLVGDDLLVKHDEKERKYPVRLRSTRSLQYEDTVQIPAGWTVVQPPADVAIDNAVAAVNFKFNAENNQVACTYRVDVKKHYIPAEEYAQYKEVSDAVIKLRSQWIVCRTDAPGAPATAGRDQGAGDALQTR